MFLVSSSTKFQASLATLYQISFLRQGFPYKGWGGGGIHSVVHLCSPKIFFEKNLSFQSPPYCFWKKIGGILLVRRSPCPPAVEESIEKIWENFVKKNWKKGDI